MPSPLGHALGGVIVYLMAADARSHEAADAQRHEAADGADARRREAADGADAQRLEAADGADAQRPEAADGADAKTCGRLTGAGAERRWVPLALTVAAAVLPDIDFLWGRHSMETHSLGAAVLAGAAVLGWSRGRRRRLAGLVAMAWASHVLFDWLGSDDAPPLGVMALWPVTADFYFAQAYVFDAISRRLYAPGVWLHNARAVAWEVAMLAPPAAALWQWRWRRTRERDVGAGRR